MRRGFCIQSERPAGVRVASCYLAEASPDARRGHSILAEASPPARRPLCNRPEPFPGARSIPCNLAVAPPGERSTPCNLAVAPPDARRHICNHYRSPSGRAEDALHHLREGQKRRAMPSAVAEAPPSLGFLSPSWGLAPAALPRCLSPGLQIREPSRDLKSEAGTNSLIGVLTDSVPAGNAIIVELHAVGVWIGHRRRPVDGVLLQGCASGGADS